MKRVSFVPTVIASCSAFLVACSEGPEAGSKGDGVAAPGDGAGGNDTSDVPEGADVADPPEASGDDAASDAGSDADDVSVDACAGFVCAPPPSSHCAVHREALVRFGDGVCIADDGPACHYAEEPEPCGVGALCIDGACQAMPSRCDFPVGDHLTVTRFLDFGNQSDERDPETGEPVDACCTDFDGDGFVDNAMGDSFRELAPILGPTSTIWQGVIQRGPPLFELRGVDDWVNDAEVEVFGYGGKSYVPATGVVTIAADGFEPGTNLPPMSGRGFIQDGVLHLVDGYQRTVLGPADIPIIVEITRFELRGKITPAADGIGFALDGLDGEPGARASGLIERDAVLAALNLHGPTQCHCATFGVPDEPFIDLVSGTCQPIELRDPTPGCEESDPLCQLLEGPLCDFLVARLLPDIDTNDDGQADAISVGQWTTAIPVHRKDPAEGCP